MSYIKNSNIRQGNNFNLSGSSLTITGSLTGSQISGTVAQFATISGSTVSASQYLGPIGSGSAGGTNTTVQFNNNGSFSGSTNFVFDSINTRVGIGTSTPSALFSVGTSSQFQVNSSGDIIKIKNISYLWPSSAPTQNNLVLSVSDFNTGQLAWVTSSGGGGGSATPVGPNQSIQFNSGSQFSGSANLLWNYTSNSLLITGSLVATTKSFDIVHPTKEGMRLRYGSLEGPENGVYVRGVTTENVIELPEHWLGLVDEETITVNLTPIGARQTLWVKDIKDNKVYIGGKLKKCHFTVFGERKDVSKLVVEY